MSFLKALPKLAPGFIVCALAGILSYVLAEILKPQFPGISALLIAIILGIIVGNLTRGKLQNSAHTQLGITFSAKKVLRAGIVLLGLQVSLAQITQLGWQVVLIAVVAVGVGFATALLIGRLSGMSQSLTLLIAAGFSICGAAAVAAVDGILDKNRKEHETVTALALVVACGTLMIFALPATAALLGLSNMQTGIWAGAAVHEVAQVVAIGGSLSTVALSAAVIVKLTRVLMLAPIMVGVSAYRRRQLRSAVGAGATSAGKLPPIMPLFVALFILAVLITSVFELPAMFLAAVAQGQTLLLAAAMFALGLGVRLSVFKKVGSAPLVSAVVTTVVIAAVTLGGVLLFTAKF